MFQYRTITLLLCMHITATLAVIQPLYKGCGGTEAGMLGTAIQDAIDMADEAVDKLNIYNFGNQQPSWADAAYRPLFQDSNKARLLTLYDRVKNIRTLDDVDITFYCSENHIVEHNNKYADQDYYYINSNGQKRPAPVYVTGDASSKPGAKGSYTTSGFKPRPDVDFSKQVHIFIHPQKFRPSATGDRRPFNEVRAFGLKEGQNRLDALRPLMETVFHELIHAVGGIVAPDNNQLVIGDGPLKNTYGWVRCSDMNIDNLPFVSTVNVADCVTILAKALYLQINKPGKYTYWSTGIVDIDSLEPLDIPLAPRRRSVPLNRYERRAFTIY